MAKRTRGVAGINGDYFDIGNTNRPENIVVRDGALLQPPYKRYALAITRDGVAHIAEFCVLRAAARSTARTIPLDGIDELPPRDGGISLLTPLTAASVRKITSRLSRSSRSPERRRSRVIASRGIADNLQHAAAGILRRDRLERLQRRSTFLDVGAVVDASGALDPIELSLDRNRDRRRSADPARRRLVRRRGRTERRGVLASASPCSGAAIAPDGRLFLVEVDGRQAEFSVGLKRPEFAALMRSFGATEGLASTAAARRRSSCGASATASADSRRTRRRTASNARSATDSSSTVPRRPDRRSGWSRGRASFARYAGAGSYRCAIAAVDAANHVAASGGAVQVSVAPASLG